jgi:hypothetical protein
LLRTWCQGWHRWCLYSFKQCNNTIWLSCWEHKWDYYDVIDLGVDVQDVVLKLLVTLLGYVFSLLPDIWSFHLFLLMNKKIRQFFPLRAWDIVNSLFSHRNAALEASHTKC